MGAGLKTLCILLQIFSCARGNYFTRSLQLWSRLTKHAGREGSERPPSDADITPPDISEPERRVEGQLFTLIICTAKGKACILRCLLRAQGFVPFRQ